MKYHEKLSRFFKSKNLKIKDVSIAIGYSEGMTGKYIRTNAPNFEFIAAVTKAYPDVDWNYLLKEDDNIINEEGIVSQKSLKQLILKMENTLKDLKIWHENDRNKKQVTDN